MKYASIIASLFLLETGQMVFSAPIPSCLVDMTYPLNNQTVLFPIYKNFQIVKKFLDIEGPDKFRIQYEEISGVSHTGTHIDSPAHFIKNAVTVDRIPLKTLMDIPVAVIDVTKKVELDPDYTFTIEDMMEWEKKTSRKLINVVVFMRTGWGKRWGDREAFLGTSDGDDKLHFPGFSKEAALWLLHERKIYGVGTEAISFDSGLDSYFITHRIFLAGNIYGIENLANMHKLPIVGAKVTILPMKLEDASGSPSRIVAFFPKHSRHCP